MKLTAIGIWAAALLALGTAPAMAAPATTAVAAKPDAALLAAVSGPQRKPENRARDVARKPVETMTFLGLRPGMTIMDLQPGGGWWTEILAPYAKATGGRYIAGLADLSDPKLSERAKKGRADFLAKFSDANVYGRVEAADFGRTSGSLAPAATVDLVLSAREFHNWVGGSADKMLADIAAALKPGGVLMVEDHRALPGRATDGSTGYVTEQQVIDAAAKAGLKLAGRSDLYANPRDTRDYPFGVWTLPPVRQSAPSGQPANPAFDHAKYDAIGESDRMLLKFVKG